MVELTKFSGAATHGGVAIRLSATDSASGFAWAECGPAVSKALERFMITTVLLATILSIAAAAQQRDQQAVKSPFVGRWSADLSQSRLDPKMSIKGADVTISVNGKVITLANSVVMPSGETIQEREILRADGTETAATNPSTAGMMHVANWVGSHVFALITKKGDQNIALITYEVSTDGQTLTVRTSGLIEQVVIFKRCGL
jgi:hypothetical protein